MYRLSLIFFRWIYNQTFWLWRGKVGHKSWNFTHRCYKFCTLPYINSSNSWINRYIFFKFAVCLQNDIFCLLKAKKLQFSPIDFHISLQNGCQSPQNVGLSTRETTVTPKPIEISISNFDQLFSTLFARSVHIKNTIIINGFSSFTSKWQPKS